MKKKIKRIKKENNNKRIVIDIMFYMVLVILGYLCVDYENFNIRYDFKMISCVFFIIAFLASIAYLMTKRKGDIEYLIFCFINMLAGAYIWGINYTGRLVVVGDSLLIYSAAIILNKFYSAKVLLKYKNTNFLLKIANGVMLIIISVFAVYSLYTKEEVSNMIIGYYLMGVGLLNLLEPLVNVILSNPKVDSFLISMLKYKEYENTPIKKPKAISKKRISVKKTS